MKSFIAKGNRFLVWLLAFRKVRDLTEEECAILQELLNGRWRV